MDFSVSEYSYNFSRKIGQVFLGSFVVTNNTTELPTEFSILAPKSKYIQLSALSGKLDGSEMNGICTKGITCEIPPNNISQM